MDCSGAGTVADHAYWLSGLKLRNAGGDAPLGHVDARSAAFGHGDPTPGSTQTGGGVLTGGNYVAMPYVERSKAWGAAPSTNPGDTLHLDVQNLSRVVVHPRRARLTCSAKLDVSTDGPLAVRLSGCGRTV